LILEKYSREDWKHWLALYKEGKITVGEFNTRIFSTVKEDKQTLINFVREHAKVRLGFIELLDFCKQNDYEFAVISNGLDFYIDFILTGLGLSNVNIIAAKTTFNPIGMKVKYIGPDGNILMDKFKEAFTRQYIGKGYRVIYAGNGLSDFPAATLSHRIFAREELAECCEKAGVPFTPFEDLNDIIRGLNDPR
jgi:2-hydroxy-3-keto-5-methylthiopentenyl-1-phosphate phosphatase